MLILTRRIEESFIINDNITITLIDVKGKQARFGIDAPREITIHRKEIYDKIQHDKKTGSN